jgi:hypothetical protein
MVAACRALETESTDGLVRDPFAAELAGQRGMAIARAVPGLPVLCFGVGIRSRFLDELLGQALADARIATVVALGAGLDTRPWRLDLRPDLRWIEVDFPAMLEYKSAVMAPHQPKCRIERLAADLNDASARAAVFAAVGEDSALMITEGLLMYLPAETIEALATEPVYLSGIRHWLLDLATPEMGKRVGMDQRQAFLNVRAPDHLNGAKILELLHRTGGSPGSDALTPATPGPWPATGFWREPPRRLLQMHQPSHQFRPPPTTPAACTCSAEKSERGRCRFERSPRDSTDSRSWRSCCAVARRQSRRSNGSALRRRPRVGAGDGRNSRRLFRTSALVYTAGETEVPGERQPASSERRTASGKRDSRHSGYTSRFSEYHHDGFDGGIL